MMFMAKEITKEELNLVKRLAEVTKRKKMFDTENVLFQKLRK